MQCPVKHKDRELQGRTNPELPSPAGVMKLIWFFRSGFFFVKLPAALRYREADKPGMRISSRGNLWITYFQPSVNSGSWIN
jgi:hypothetical protein